MELSKCICLCHCLCLCLCLCHCLFYGQVMSPNHSDQMSQRSTVSKIPFCRFSLNVFVAVFLLVRSCLLITLIRCLICHKRPGSLCSGLKFPIVSCARARDIVTYRAVSESDYVWTVKVKSDYLKGTMPKKVQIFFRSVYPKDVHVWCEKITNL